MLRRLAVLAVVLLGIVGLVAVGRAVIGDGRTDDVSVSPNTTAGAADAGGPDAAPGTASGPLGESGSSGPLDPNASAAPVATDPAGPRVPSAADPARVLLVGDSQAQGLEPFLAAELDDDPFTTLTTFGRNSSGFVRPDFFDWPARLTELVATEDPDIVVMFIGGNETQQFLHMPGKPIDSPEWRAEYGTRIGAAMDLLRADGRTLIWIGVPMPGDEWQRSRLAVQNEVVREHAAARPDVVFIDTWVLFSGIDGSYAPLVLDPLTGTYRALRSERDEFHLNVAGTKLLAAAVDQAIAADLARRGTVGIEERATTTVDFAMSGTYTIDDGDSLSAIAARTGTTVADIVAVNGWQDHNHLIVPGQKITLPTRTP